MRAAEPHDRVERVVGGALVISVLGSIAAAIAYWVDAGTQVLGTAITVSLAGMAVGVGTWALRAMPGGGSVEKRGRLASSDDDRAAAAAGFEEGEVVLGRRSLLVKLFGVSAVSFGAMALFPFRSLGPRPGDALRRTGWRSGTRLVTEEGTPLRPDDLPVDGFTTVLPEGGASPADSQTVLIRLPDGVNQPRQGREGWVQDGCIAYSKVCTHAGCPVGLYETETHRLVCPCHQSLFDVADGARPLFGPAAQSLPQLPLEIDADGYLVAGGDYGTPVGPPWWGRS